MSKGKVFLNRASSDYQTLFMLSLDEDVVDDWIGMVLVKL